MKRIFYFFIFEQKLLFCICLFDYLEAIQKITTQPYINIIYPTAHMTRYKDVICKVENKAPKLRNLPKAKKLEKTQQFKESLVATTDEDSTTSLQFVVKPKFKLRKVILIYSRIHFKLRLRFQTLFKAITLYMTYEQIDQSLKCLIPEEYLMLVCMYLSMKYQQIYPPRLKQVGAFLIKNHQIDLKDYRKFEKSVFEVMGGNLNIPTPQTVIDDMLVNQQTISYYHAYFLLEVSLINEEIAEFGIKLVCLGILYLMTKISDLLKKRKSIGLSQEKVHDCSKLIIKARHNTIFSESTISKKYSHETYMRVAQQFIYLESQ